MSFDPPIVITMPSMNDSHEDSLERALALHRRAVVIDSHCDTTQRLLDPHWDFAARHDIWHVDIPRLRDGGVDALVLAVYAATLRDKHRGGADAVRRRGSEGEGAPVVPSPRINGARARVKLRAPVPVRW